MKRKNHPVVQLGNARVTKRLYGNLSSSQKARTLKNFEMSSTIQASTNIEVMHIDVNIKEFRGNRHIIVTNLIEVLNNNTVIHRTGLHPYHGQAKESYHE